MGKGRPKRKGKANRQAQRTREEFDPLEDMEMGHADAERRAKLSPKDLAARAGSDPPPILGEPDSLSPLH